MNFNKRLVYHLYLYDGCFNSKVYKLHMACLSHFSYIFNQAIFVLALNDTENIELIKTAEKKIFENIHIDDIKFVVKENDDFREAKTFYDEIVNKMSELDGITFFGHIKGAGNEMEQSIDMEQVYNWIIAAYYLNFVDMNGVEWYLFSSPSFKTYGSLKCTWKDIENKYEWIYSGTFFWLNAQRIYLYLKNNEIEIPPLNNRYCAETFCGNILPFNNAETASFNLRHCVGNENEKFMNWYKYATSFIEMYLNDDIKSDYYNFRDNMLKLINE